MSLCVLISVHAHVRVRVRRVRAAVRYLFDAPQLRAEYSAGFGWSLLVSQWACAVRGRARQSPAAVVRWQPWKRQFALGWSWVGVGLELGWSWVGIWNLACLAVSGRGKMTYAADSAARATCAGAAAAGINQRGKFQPRLEMPPPLRGSVPVMPGMERHFSAKIRPRMANVSGPRAEVIIG